MTNLPNDQRLLYRDLCQKLDEQGSSDQLIQFMASVLHSLLRRRGDQEFRLTVQDAFTQGLAGRDFADQVTLAREVIGLVIAKRPEIAQAWQKLHQIDVSPFHRRQCDESAMAPLAPEEEADDLPDFSIEFEEDGVEPGDYSFDDAEKQTAAYMADAIDRRLACFVLPQKTFPSAVYYHEEPFFLFGPGFAAAVRRFIQRSLLVRARGIMGDTIYAPIAPALRQGGDALTAALTEKRPDIWKIAIDELIQLADLHHGAQAKLDAAANPGAPEYRVVQVPVTRPRVIRVLGVAFTVGSRTDIKKKKIPINVSQEPSAEEMDALEVMSQFSGMAALEGLDLPPGADFAFLSGLFEVDRDAFARDLDELMTLCARTDGERETVFTHLKTMDATHPGGLVDAAMILAFHTHTKGAFGFQELYAVATGAAGKGWTHTNRPFLLAEVKRRPRDLAFQMREALRRRSDRNSIGLAIAMLFEVWKELDPVQFQAEMDAALTVFTTFPVAFSGDQDEAVLSRVGQVMQQSLTGPKLETGATIEAVLRVYSPLVGQD